MKKIIIPLSIMALLLSSAFVSGDNDKHEREEEHEGKGFFNRIFGKEKGVASIKNVTYKEECGSCHFAYQPGLLPARSWKKIMSDLENHFDENAELEKDVQTSLTNYLMKNAADQSNYKRSRRIMNSLSNNSTPLRITETPYFIRKHDEIPRRLVKDNPKLGSFSKCDACHTNADKGSFNEHEVNIPGVGRWED